MANIKSTDDKSIVHAYPTKDLFISILVRDVTMKDAIGDLLDNSVDGALRLRQDQNYKGLEVTIEIDPERDHFMISDNCGGIRIDLARDYAFRFGAPEDAELTKYSVGVFGIGMKRALFRLGREFTVKSTAEDSCFELSEDVAKWKKADDSSNNPKSWQFKFLDGWREKVRPKFPLEKRGTTITVTKLHPDVKDAFSLDTEITDLIAELQREHLLNIDKGLKITVNGIPLRHPSLNYINQ